MGCLLLMGRPTKKVTQQKQLAVIVKDLVESNPNISDVGAILACLKNDVSTLNSIKNECTTIDEFIDIASKRANIALVTAAIEAAIGYDYEETEQLIRKVPHYGENGKLEIREVPADLKIKKKHAKKNDQLLKFILANRLPEYFSDSRKVEINKKSIEIKMDTEKEIKGFCGKLLDVIDAEFVNENS